LESYKVSQGIDRTWDTGQSKTPNAASQIQCDTDLRSQGDFGGLRIRTNVWRCAKCLFRFELIAPRYLRSNSNDSAAYAALSLLVVPEQRQQQNDRQRDAQ
jgi:hypothetical protein